MWRFRANLYNGWRHAPQEIPVSFAVCVLGGFGEIAFTISKLDDSPQHIFKDDIWALGWGHGKLVTMDRRYVLSPIQALV